eukprot:UN25041
MNVEVIKEIEKSYISRIYSTSKTFCAVGPSVSVQWGERQPGMEKILSFVEQTLCPGQNVSPVRCITDTLGRVVKPGTNLEVVEYQGPTFLVDQGHIRQPITCWFYECSVVVNGPDGYRGCLNTPDVQTVSGPGVLYSVLMDILSSFDLLNR